MTKIDIISGFLGAGKTTLIKKLIEDVLHEEKIVLIENEFGEIGIDGGFLKDAGIEIREMNSGCICCSLVGDFASALGKVLEEYHPDRIVIEPSGVGKLSDVIKAVKDMGNHDIQLNSFTTVADAQKCKMYMKNFGEFFNNQVEYAGTIILSRTQNLNEDKLEAVVHELRTHNASATIITTPWDQLSGNEILAVMEKTQTLEKELMEEVEVCPVCGHHHEHEEHHHEHEEHHHHHEGCEHGHHHEHEEHDHHHDHDCCCEHDHHEHHHHHHADEVFTSWGMETPKTYTREALESILKELSEGNQYGMILRAKGMLPDEEGHWMYFDLVPEEYEIREGIPTYTGRFCVIGSKINEEALKELFHIA